MERDKKKCYILLIHKLGNHILDMQNILCKCNNLTFLGNIMRCSINLKKLIERNSKEEISNKNYTSRRIKFSVFSFSSHFSFLIRHITLWSLTLIPLRRERARETGERLSNVYLILTRIREKRNNPNYTIYRFMAN